VDKRPAGFSARWLQDVLRGRMGFTGAVFSDDLGMAAARQIDGNPVSFSEAALAALHAGCDMVLLCNQCVVDGGAPIDEAIEALSRAAVQGGWQPSPASDERRRALLPESRAMGWDELMVSARYMHALSLLP
jgi:beta-N-acetylhexosaminidase